MNRKIKLTVAAVVTAAVASMGLSTAALADAGAAESKVRSMCC